MSRIDYDPVKAHEYYMKHRKLKGRHSTKGFSQTQKEQWSYAKNQLSEQKKQENASITKQKQQRNKALSEAKKKQKEQLTKITKEKVEALKQRLKSLSGKDRDLLMGGIQDAIYNLKNGLAGKKKSIDLANKAAREKNSADAKADKEQVKVNYEKGLDEAYKKIRG